MLLISANLLNLENAILKIIKISIILSKTISANLLISYHL